MARALLVLHTDAIREKAVRWIWGLPKDTRIEFKGPKRTLPQNARQWAMLSEVANQLVWHGVKYPAEVWKDYFMYAYKGATFMPGENGGVVPVGRSTSDLSKEEHSELTALIEAFCARNGVTFHWED
jgi:hypothetical protein